MSDSPRSPLPRGTIEQRLDRAASEAFWLAVHLAYDALFDPERNRALLLDYDRLFAYLDALVAGELTVPERHEDDEGDEWKVPEQTKGARDNSRVSAERIRRHLQRVRAGTA